MNNKCCLSVYVTVGLMLAPQLALAYVGPGTGLSAIGSFFALLMTIVLVIVGFFWLPLKRVLKSRQKTSETPPKESAPEDVVARTTVRTESPEDSSTP